MFKYPYTNDHELNLDWIIGIIKDFKNNYSGINTALDEAISAITAKGEATEADIEALRVAAGQAIQEYQAAAIRAIESAGDTAEGELLDASTAGINAIQNLVQSLPGNSEEMLGQLQIINSILNGTQSEAPTWAQGIYQFNTTSQQYEIVNSDYYVSSVMQGGCNGRRIKIKSNNSAQKIYSILWWDAYKNLMNTVNMGWVDSVEYVFPQDAHFFSIVLTGAVNPPNASISVNDTNVNVEWNSIFTDIEANISTIKNNSIYKNIITITELEEGYYSTVNGTKQPNSINTNYKRTINLIKVDELSLYVSNIYVSAICFDNNKQFLGNIMLYPMNTKARRKLTPANTTFIGLYATNLTSFTIQKINYETFKNAEFPYTGRNYIHLENAWCNGNGEVNSTTNFDLLIIPVNSNEKYFISNDASYNCICFDINDINLSTTYEQRPPIGRVYTTPENSVIMYVNLYRNRTKGISNEMADYISKIENGNILAIGDSITWLDGRPGYGGAEYFTGWQKQLRMAGYDVISAAWSGYPYASGLDIVENVSYSIYQEIVENQYDVSNYDFVVLAGGTNDVIYNGPIGEEPHDYNNRVFDGSTFHGALSGIISYIRNNNPTAKIILSNFPKSEATSRTFDRSIARIDAIKYNAMFWSCRYVNVFQNMNVQPSYPGFTEYFYDSTHPNYNGMAIIGDLILHKIQQTK